MSVHDDAMLPDKLGIKPGVSATTIRKSSGREKYVGSIKLGHGRWQGGAVTNPRGQWWAWHGCKVSKGGKRGQEWTILKTIHATTSGPGQFVVVDVLVAKQCVCMREGEVNSDGPLEETDGTFMVLLWTVAIADYTPRLRALLIGLHNLQPS